ncbi:MAG: hypothetical protein WC315_00465 [Candidatus Omnitrophota bacterium]|jgi:hypothetical protein
MEKLIVLILIFIVSLVGFMITDAAFSTSETTQGVVLEKVYSPATTGTGVGVAAGGKTITPVVVVTSSAEDFVVLVKCPYGTFSSHTTAGIYGSVDKGVIVTLIVNRGYWTNGIWCVKIAM